MHIVIIEHLVHAGVDAPARSPPSPSTPHSAELDMLPCLEEKILQQGEVQFTYGVIQSYPTSPSFLVAVSLKITQQGNLSLSLSVIHGFHFASFGFL
jgi:hypothetical protein